MSNDRANHLLTKQLQTNIILWKRLKDHLFDENAPCERMNIWKCLSVSVVLDQFEPPRRSPSIRLNYASGGDLWARGDRAPNKKNTRARVYFRPLTASTVFWALLCPECVCCHGSAPNPTDGAYSAPRTPTAGGIRDRYP